jgi:hypothetical protein
VTIEIILLGLASAVRPSSFVAVLALVRAATASRLMAAYVAAGLAFTIAVGVAVVWIFSGISINAGTDRTKAIAEITAGALAVGFGVAVLLRRVPVGDLASEAASEGRFDRLRQIQPTPRAAAFAGPITHIPGLLYLLALDLIVSQEPGVAGGLVEVGIYNAVWFILPISVLVVCVVNPPAARAGVQKLQAWAGANARAIVLVIAFGLGGLLLVKGAMTL